MKGIQFALLGLVTVLTLLFAPSLKAQFAGDLFFAEPSVAISEGSQGTLEVQAFSGADTFGAAQFELVYDPEQLEVLAVRPGNTPELQDGFTFTRSEGRVSIIVLNSGSLDMPFGTSSLVELEVKPLAVAGSVIHVGNQVQDVLRQDSTPYASPAGLGAEIVVSAPGINTTAIQPASHQPVEVEAGTELHQRVVALRRAGSVVTLMELDDDHHAYPLAVKAEGLASGE